MPYVVCNKHHSIAKPNQNRQKNFWRKTFERELERKILRLQLLETNPENSLISFPNSSGKFSSKSKYQVSQLGRGFENIPQESKSWKKLWKLKIKYRFKRLPSVDYSLAKRYLLGREGRGGGGVDVEV